MLFDGIDDYIETNKPIIPSISEDFTLLINSCLVQTGNTTDDMILVDNRDENDHGLVLFRDKQSKQLSCLISGVNGTTSLSGEEWDDLSWHFHAFWRKAGKIYLQTDLGQIYTAPENSGSILSHSTLKIGRRSRSMTGFFKGHIGGLLQLFGRALEDDERKNQYRVSWKQIVPTPPACILYYNLIRPPPGLSQNALVFYELKSFLEELLGKQWLISREKRLSKERSSESLMHGGLRQWLICKRHFTEGLGWSQSELDDFSTLLEYKLAYEYMTPAIMRETRPHLMQDLRTRHYDNYMYETVLAAGYKSHNLHVEFIKEETKPSLKRPEFRIQHEQSYIYCEAKKLDPPWGRVALARLSEYMLPRIKTGLSMLIELDSIPSTPREEDQLRAELKRIINTNQSNYETKTMRVTIHPIDNTMTPLVAGLAKFIKFKVRRLPSIFRLIKRRLEDACKQLKTAPKGCPRIVHIDISNFIFEPTYNEIADVRPPILEEAKSAVRKELTYHTSASAVVLTWSDIISLCQDSQKPSWFYVVRMRSESLLHNNPQIPLPDGFELFPGWTVNLILTAPF
ncbi:MAG: hypothetical protein ACPLY9_04540 [Nitrososphaerales archaeon]